MSNNTMSVAVRHMNIFFNICWREGRKSKRYQLTWFVLEKKIYGRKPKTHKLTRTFYIVKPFFLIQIRHQGQFCNFIKSTTKWLEFHMKWGVLLWIVFSFLFSLNVFVLSLPHRPHHHTLPSFFATLVTSIPWCSSTMSLTLEFSLPLPSLHSLRSLCNHSFTIIRSCGKRISNSIMRGLQSLQIFKSNNDGGKNDSGDGRKKKTESERLREINHIKENKEL